MQSDFSESTEVNEFICKDKPILFVNVDGKEERVGTSYRNPDETKAIIGLMRWMNEQMEYSLGRFAIIGTYRGQVTYIKDQIPDDLTKNGFSLKNVMTVD